VQTGTQIGTWFSRAALAAFALLAGACDTPNYSTAAAQPSGETFKDFGNYEVHFNAIRTDSLTPDIARAYDIRRASNRIMLNVAVLAKQADHVPRKPVEADVQVDAYNLNGQLKNFQMRRVSEGEAIYYIGEISISGQEILVFDISVRPAGETSTFEVKFKREFFSG